MKTVTIICESFNRYDLIDATIPGVFDTFIKADFNLAPAYDSVSALHLLQAGRCRSYAKRHHHRPIFSRKGNCIGNRFKTRIASSRWPRACNAQVFDSTVNRRGVPFGQRGRAIDGLTNGFYGTDCEHFIYWGSEGHVRRRIGKENRGIPRRLTLTMNNWLQILSNEILPLIDLQTTAVLMHPDHGSARRGLSKRQAMHDGFLWVHSPSSFHQRDSYDWQSMRELLVHFLESPCFASV